MVQKQSLKTNNIKEKPVRGIESSWMNNLEIVQLSDIHMVGSYFRQDSFDVVIDEVNNKLKPELIIITGDITDEGLLFQFKRARAEISRFNRANIIVLSGNRDYRYTGYLLFKRFFPSSIQIYDFNDSVVVLTAGTARADLDEGR
jgi:predicted MPP superfamily phosphohydrolase